MWRNHSEILSTEWPDIISLRRRYLIVNWIDIHQVLQDVKDHKQQECLSVERPPPACQ